jgi:hypothetical protein
VSALETLRAGVDWAQGLTPIPKIVISFVLFLLWVLGVTILWQKPHDKSEEQAQTTTTQTGNTMSTGQSGGVTAGLYINQAPPVTAQQKEEALLSLQSELEELSNFPNRPDGQQPRTYFEMLAAQQMPRRLYTILTKYYKPTIESVPTIGADLFNYKTKYYEFQEKEYNFENELTTQIGRLTQTQFREGWGLCLRYFIMRTHGLSKEQIISGGNFLNYGISWDDAERIFNELLKSPDVAQKVDIMRTLQNGIWEEANRVMHTYKEKQ